MTPNRFGTALFVALLLTPLLTVTPVSARTGDRFPDLEMAPLNQLALATVEGHNHFHIARFNVVRLTPAPGSTYTMTERRLRKIGFCLVDSIRKSPAPPNQAPSPSFYSCGYSGSTFVRTGISVGWGDIYSPSTAFQDIDVSGLPDGNYRLCATVNPFSVWTEKGKNHANNSKWTDVHMDQANNILEKINEGEGC